MHRSNTASHAGPAPLSIQITPMILTYNEAPNIQRTVEKLLWAERIVVIDSGSTDDTVPILRNYPQVEVFDNRFEDFASQCNFGLDRVESPWVLSLDADYALSDELVTELRFLAPPDGVAGYRARFVYQVYGRRLRGSLYPPRTVLHKKGHASYRQEGHAHRVIVDGDVLPLAGVIYHDDRKPLGHWFAAQQRYARDEAEYLLSLHRDSLRRTDRIRLMGWPAPVGAFFYTLLVKGCVLDGWAGWYYALQRVAAETLLALEIIDRRFRLNGATAGDG
jgi:glycosyltransferase involved in cell wall biosynthesis